MVEIDEKGPPLAEKDVSDFKEKTGVRLPGAYRKFLAEINGGRPEPDVINIDDCPYSPTDVMIFFGIGRNIESSTLAWHAEVFSARLRQNDLLSIARNSGGMCSPWWLLAMMRRQSFIALLISRWTIPISWLMAFRSFSTRSGLGMIECRE